MKIFEHYAASLLLGERLLNEDMMEYSLVLKKDESDAQSVLSDLRREVSQLKRDFHKRYMDEKSKFKKMKPAEEAEFRKSGGREPLEKWAEIEVDTEPDTYVVNIKIEDPAAAKKVFDEKMKKRIQDVGSIEDFSD